MTSKAVFKTKITEMLGIQYPIICGGMNLLSRAELVSAVSNAGGLGILVSAMYQDKEQLREEIRKTKKLTNKPFGVNINIFPMALRPGVSRAEPEDFIGVLIDEGVHIVETSGRSPEPYMERLKKGKITVMHKTTAVRFARTAERLGVDAVIIVGFEGAGHPGMDDVATMVLVPQTVDAVKVPVIAAGGIGDARGFVAALALGAEGVVIGTRFMATKESPAHPALKEAMVKASELDTVMTQRSIKNAARDWNNEAAQKCLQMEQRGASLDELLTVTSGELGKKVILEGDLNAGLISFGQVVGQVHSIPTVKEVMDGIIEGALAIRQRLFNQVIKPA